MKITAFRNKSLRLNSKQLNVLHRTVRRALDDTLPGQPGEKELHEIKHKLERL